jgi:hypothetical protein
MRATTEHAWTEGPRWPQCSRCGARAHWIEASKDCPGAPKKDEEIGIEIAIARIRSDLDAFRFWWLGRADLGTTRPTLAEWRAEFLEWSRANGASAAP